MNRQHDRCQSAAKSQLRGYGEVMEPYKVKSLLWVGHGTLCHLVTSQLSPVPPVGLQRTKSAIEA
jgi:hypothetical protein